MKTMTAAKRMLAMLCAIVATTFALSGTAFAATVTGADYSGSGSAIKDGSIDVLHVDGKAGESVFITVKQGDKTIAKNLPYTVGADASAGDEFTWTGTATLNISTLKLDELKKGTYTIEAYADRAATKNLYSGKLHGVYADLPDKDKTQLLIGTRTINSEEADARSFSAPTTIYNDGRSYRLGDKVEGAEELHFTYVEYDEANTASGVVNYLDSKGNVLAKSEVPGIKNGDTRDFEIPETVVAENGDLYRTVFFKNSVTMKNPDALSFSVYCTKISDADKALAGYYLATIKMVDEKGDTIASDSVNVTGNFVYTAPTTIYKKKDRKTQENPNEPAAVYTYTIKDSPTIHLSAQVDKVKDRKRTIEVQYETTDPDAPTAEVTFNLLDGSKRVGEDGRKLGTYTTTVNLDSPTAKPESTITYEGTTYYIAGSPDDYAYELRSGDMPSINVYYTPEGYIPPGPYEVAVNYVNYLTNEVVESHTYTSDPNATGAMAIETPATFSANGVDYVRLDGQEDAIQHSYYSNISTYVVYYRDVNDTLTSGTVINTIRVVYRDAEPTTTTTGGGTTTTGGGTTTTEEGADEGTEGGADAGAAEGGVVAGDGAAADGGDAAAGAAAGDAAAGAAAGDGTTNAALNDTGTYNVADGDNATGTLTNEAGVDSNTERIEDSETPLASGFDKGGTSSAASSLTAMILPISIGLVVVLAIAAAIMYIRRRKNNEANEA